MASNAIKALRCSNHFYEGDDLVFSSLHRQVPMVYFDDILIYCKIKVDHLEHLQIVLRTLRQERFFMNTKKYTFMNSCIVLVFVVSFRGEKVDPKKVRVILD